MKLSSQSADRLEYRLKYRITNLTCRAELLYSDVRGFLLDGLALLMLATGIGIMTKMAKFEI
ncbi:MAG: hypothetical protein JOY83_17035 [Alphaproteobacteria bacterium]|nr:hypothetical protein [Alphaproteobacteria bacterium]